MAYTSSTGREWCKALEVKAVASVYTCLGSVNCWLIRSVFGVCSCLFCCCTEAFWWSGLFRSLSSPTTAPIACRSWHEKMTKPGQEALCLKLCQPAEGPAQWAFSAGCVGSSVGMTRALLHPSESILPHRVIGYYFKEPLDLSCPELQ